MICTLEEADIRIFLHVKVPSTSCCERNVIVAFDTDIVVIAMYLFDHFRADGLLEPFILTKDYAIHIHSLLPGFSTSEQTMIPLMYALSGCDTNGFMFGKGKLLFLRQYNTATELGRLCTEMEIGMDIEVINETIHIAT